ncbi:MAG: FHA domain-containing protein [Actinobacteria bacterium]|nr:FHA domain-containing protein [Actinomycetota bacterium]
MQLVLEEHHGERELDIVVHDPEATVADLVSALVGGDPTGFALVAGGTTVPAERRLERAGLVEGAPVRVVPLYEAPGGPGAGPIGAAPATLSVDVVGGLHAGTRASVGPGTWAVGRDVRGVPLTDPTVSSHHADLAVAADGTMVVSDRGSFNGTWLEGAPQREPFTVPPGRLVRMGASQIAVRVGGDDDRPAGLAAARPFGSAAIPFNRPPRPAPPALPEPVDPPRAPESTATPSALGIASILAPAAFGVVMLVVYRNAMFALFALLSPVMAIGTWLETRRRNRKGRRRDRARFERDLSELRERLAELAVAERARLEDVLPDPAEVVRRATLPSTRLWERRPGHHDSLALRVGVGPVTWWPPVSGERRHWADEVRDEVRAASVLSEAPVGVDLAGGGVVGLVGDRAACVAVARSLVVQTATHHGPADLPAMVLVAPDHERDWDWAKWLPHTLDPGGSGHRMLAADREAADGMLRAVLERASAARDERAPRAGTGDAPGPATLVVVDDEGLTEGRRSPARSVLRGAGGPVAGIVLAATADRLPSVCTTVVEVLDPAGTAQVHRVSRGEVVDGVLGCGMDEPVARRAARALARFEDPELDVAGAGLPASVGLLPLLDLDPPTPEAVAARWAQAGPDPDLVAPIGVAEDGVLAVDLVRDGPHGLVAGTTGAGKSELLRSLVAGLAAGSPPEHLTFVLIDFKGGAAFDQCARLPHTVGFVTDLDAHLAQRALRCLEAELRHRERALRDAGAADLREYRRLPGEREPIPRLVVVIDEFATLKAELPDFVDALVGVAQRGRSLGVHLVLATQRPSGAVSDNIRANANLRIALRVQDAGDSTDVIEVPDAARIGRSQPGRALARLGPGEVVPIQTALSTGVARSGGHHPVEVRPFRFGPQPPALATRTDAADPATAPTDLELLVEAMAAAHHSTGRARPRQPWPEPLPAEVDLDEILRWAEAGTGTGPGAGTGPGRGRGFAAPGVLLPVALADDPDAQSQYPAGWTPSEGNLLLVGLAGSGTTTALISIGLAAAQLSSPDDLHVYALDFGAGELDVLAGLPHCGAVVLPGERERQIRLVRHLKAELDRRRARPEARTGEARVLVLLDGMAGFRSEWDDDLHGISEALQRVFADGPEVGIHCVFTGDRPAAFPSVYTSTVRQRWLFRLGDPYEFNAIGVRAADVPDFRPGGAMVAERRQEVQIARPADGAQAAVARIRTGTGDARSRPPAAIRELPADVPVTAVVAAARLGDPPWALPVGISDRTLAPAPLLLYEGEHALVAGPARSGRSTALASIATVARSVAPHVRLAALALPRSPLSRLPLLDEVVDPSAGATRAALDRLGADPRPLVVLVDDAEQIDDADGALDALLARRRADVHVVAAARNDVLRTLYTHWTRAVRQSRAGILLRPDVDLDGDLLGTHLPRRTTVPLTAGRGYLVVGGEVDLVQVARVDVATGGAPAPPVDRAPGEGTPASHRFSALEPGQT